MVVVLVPQAVRLGLPWFWDFLGIDKMSGPPITLDEPPGPRHVHSVPRVPEPVILEFDPGLVSSRLAVSLDDHTVQTSVTAKTFEEDVVALSTKLDSPQESHGCVSFLCLFKHDRI